MSEKKELSFEKALSRLEAIVDDVDNETNSLEESIKLYEEGIALAQKCTGTLDKADLRIEEVNKQYSK